MSVSNALTLYEEGSLRQHFSLKCPGSIFENINDLAYIWEEKHKNMDLPFKCNQIRY